MNPHTTPHLADERLAALDHEPPTLDELAHLAACARCRAERDAFAMLATMAVEVGAFDASGSGPRLTSWEAIAAGLREEGLLRTTVEITPLRTPVVVRAMDGGAERTVARHVDAGTASIPSFAGTRRRSALLGRTARIAAAIVALAGSAAVGRLTADVELSPNAVSPGGDVTGSIALSPAGLANTGFASVGEATAALSRAQSDYERASLWLASNDTTTRSSDVYRARLAALDQMMAASRAALRDAPQDPVLNHYFLAAYTAREATLQQLSGALPVDKTIESY